MEYAIQLILPIIGGLLLGNWLTRTYGTSPLWTVILGIVGMVMGIRILYKRSLAEQALQKEQRPLPKKSSAPPKSLNEAQTPHSESNAAHDDDSKTAVPQPQKKKTDQSSSRPPAKNVTTLDSLHDLYQQIENAPPEEQDDLPPNLDIELNRDDTKHDPKSPPSER